MATLVYSIACNPDGQMLVGGSDGTIIKLWKPHTGEQLRTLSGHSDEVQSVTFSPHGQFLASGSADKTIKIWRRI